MDDKASTNQLVTKISLIIVGIAFLTLLEQKGFGYVHIHKGPNTVRFVVISLSAH
jgi:hypothetical protein